MAKQIKNKYAQICVYVNGVCMDSLFYAIEMKYHPRHKQRINEIFNLPDTGNGYDYPEKLQEKCHG